MKNFFLFFSVLLRTTVIHVNKISNYLTWKLLRNFFVLNFFIVFVFHFHLFLQQSKWKYFRNKQLHFLCNFSSCSKKSPHWVPFHFECSYSNLVIEMTFILNFVKRLMNSFVNIPWQFIQFFFSRKHERRKCFIFSCI